MTVLLPDAMMMLNVYIWDFSLCQHTAMCWHFLSSFLIPRPDHGHKRHLPEQSYHQEHLCRASPLPERQICHREGYTQGYDRISFHFLPLFLCSSSTRGLSSASSFSIWFNSRPYSGFQSTPLWFRICVRLFTSSMYLLIQICKSNNFTYRSTFTLRCLYRKT